MSTEPWDKESVYDEQISPLMTQIIALCKEHEIPMVMQFQIADREDEGPLFCTTALPIGRACEKIRDLARRVQPERPFAIAETIVTKPDGSKHITSRLIR